MGATLDGGDVRSVEDPDLGRFGFGDRLVIDRAAQDKAADGGNALEKYGRCGPREASIIRPQEPTMHRPEHPVDLNEAF